MRRIVAVAVAPIAGVPAASPTWDLLTRFVAGSLFVLVLVLVLGLVVRARRRALGARLHDSEIHYETEDGRVTVSYSLPHRPGRCYSVVSDRRRDGSIELLASLASQPPGADAPSPGTAAGAGTAIWNVPSDTPRIHVVAPTKDEAVAMLRAAVANERAARLGIAFPDVRVGGVFCGAAKRPCVVRAVEELSPFSGTRIVVGYWSGKGEPETSVAIELRDGHTPTVIVGPLEAGVETAVIGPHSARLVGLPGETALPAALRVALALLDVRHGQPRGR